MFTFPKPKTASDALRQAKVAERARTLFSDGSYYWYDCGNGFYGVAKKSFDVIPDTTYTVVLMPAVSCSCPDFREHLDFCKHTVALWDALEAMDEEEQIERIEREAASCELETTGCDRYAEF